MCALVDAEKQREAAALPDPGGLLCLRRGDRFFRYVRPAPLGSLVQRELAAVGLTEGWIRAFLHCGRYLQPLRHGAERRAASPYTGEASPNGDIFSLRPQYRVVLPSPRPQYRVVLPSPRPQYRSVMPNSIRGGSSPPWALLLRRSRGRSRTVTHSGEGFQDIGHSPPANGKRPCRNGQTGRGVSIGEMELEKGIIMLLGGEIARQSAGGEVRVRSRKFPLAI